MASGFPVLLRIFSPTLWSYLPIYFFQWFLLFCLCDYTFTWSGVYLWNICETLLNGFCLFIPRTASFLNHFWIQFLVANFGFYRSTMSKSLSSCRELSTLSFSKKSTQNEHSTIYYIILYQWYHTVEFQN